MGKIVDLGLLDLDAPNPRRWAGGTMVSDRWRRRLATAALVALVVMGAAAVWRYLRWTQALLSARALAAQSSPTAVMEMPPEAIERLQAISLRYPQDSEIAYLLGVAFRRAGQMTKAREQFTRAEQLGYSLEDLRRQHYLVLFQKGAIKESETHLMNLLKGGCTDVVAEEIYECLVKGYLADLRLGEAMVCADYWIDWRPRSVRARLVRATVLDMASERPRLMEEYREILDLDPDCFKARLAIGHMLLKHKDIPGAQEEFRRCVEIDPASPRAQLGLAASLRQLGETERAKSMLLESLQGSLSRDEQSFALAELAQLAIERRDYNDALEHLERALQISPDDSAVTYAMGLVLSRLGKKQLAEAELEKSRRLEALGERLTDVMHEITKSPEDPASRCEAGEIMLELGLEKESLACLLSALRCDKWHAKTHQVLADFYARAGNKEMAYRHSAWAEQAVGQQKQADGELTHVP
jgi:tetratricopeptide (TPR) repeat protein